MLELRNIIKDYPTSSETVHALKGINLTFRESEFVSILGPSGCGKTTMLNIIGGLDKYTEGDLVINGRSTKEFGDRDWDSYRNHSIGFVFQSYNLIPHQTVLQNVELALTLSGVSKHERRARAKSALEEVGLGDQINKKPSEMSGGQMQRVAIARAIVNNPDIILADEPTGALDTETSVQVMEILKEISKNRLIIMVTHNPDLANRYSSRIINMLDGVITGDTDPIETEELAQETQRATTKTEAEKGVKKPSISFFTSFGLSLKNLFTKKGRTALVSFAGSIGIIGIALIYAVSHGMTAYINAVQEDTLTSYPLTIEAQTMDLGSLLEAFMGAAKSSKEHEMDAVYQKSMMYDLVNALNSAETTVNDLESFKKYIEEEKKNKTDENSLGTALRGVQYTYNTDLLVYTKDTDGKIILSDSEELMQEILLEHFGMDLSGMLNMGDSMGYMSSSAMSSLSPMSSSVLWQEMLSGENGELVNPVLKKQYDIVYGEWPTKYNEIVLVLDENNELDDMTLYALGLKTKEEIDEVTKAALNGEQIKLLEKKWSYREICEREYRTILGSDCYTYDKTTGLYTDLRNSETGLKYLYDNGLPLKVVGIIKPNEDAVSTMLNGSIAYTNALTEYIITEAEDSPAVKAQLESKDKDIFTGLPFKENTGTLTDEQKFEEFKKYIATLDQKGRAEAFISISSIPSKENLENAVAGIMAGYDRKVAEQGMAAALKEQTGMSQEEILGYLESMSDEDLKEFYQKAAVEQYKAQYAAGVKAQLSTMSETQLSTMLQMAMQNYTAAEAAVYYEEVLIFSESSYEGNLKKLGYVDLDSPATINLYAASFEDKDVIENVIAKYNEGTDEISKIKYTDYVGIMMSSITTIINAITYVLIAFVAVSLIVSSIMIGVITLISVQERTKEIGILRAIGASKKNVSGLFNAETAILGFTSGLLGVVITYLLCIPINAILYALTDISGLRAQLPLPVAILFVAISVILTLFAGIIPSRSAAKKDPVVALRTE